MMQSKFSLEELSSQLAMSKRTIRFYIQQGLVDRPEGQKRGSYYVERHLLQLSNIQQWQKAGYSLERIRECHEQGLTPAETLPPSHHGIIASVWSRFVVVNGLELNINPALTGLNADQVEELLKTLEDHFHRITKE